MKTATRSLIAFGVLATVAASASAHLSLQQPIAEVGSTYQAVLGLSHGCDGAATTAVGVRIPTGFDAPAPAQARLECRDAGRDGNVDRCHQGCRSA